MKRRDRMLDDLDGEIRDFIERETEANIARGMAPEEARYAAMRKFGNVTRVREEAREVWRAVWLEQLVEDVRFGLRILRKSPAFTLVAILTFALGIGANTALFSVVNGVVLKPLPYPHPEQLVILAERSAQFSEGSISYPNFLDWARMNHSFQAMAAYRHGDFNLTGEGEAQRVKVTEVSASFFSLVGVAPEAGRGFVAEDDRAGAAPAALVSHSYWVEHFGRSPEAIGKKLVLNGTVYTVVGVLPQSFYFCCTSMNFAMGDLYVPIGVQDAEWRESRDDHPGIFAVGRLKAGVSVEQARADLETVSRNLAAAYPDSDKELHASLAPLSERVSRPVRPALYVLLAAVGLVLLIACANVANLLVARATGRGREFALRAALGAGRHRLIRQSLTESLVLASMGGGAGVLLAWWGTHAGLKALPEALPRANDVGLDLPVLFFTLLITIVAGVLAGLLPALSSSRPNLHDTLKEGGRGASGGPHRRIQRVLVVAELALSVVLLIGSGLAVRSLASLWSVDPGFNPHNLLGFNVMLPPAMGKETPDQIRARLAGLADEVSGIPGVTAAALTDGAVPMNGDNEMSFYVEGKPKPASGSEYPLVMSYLVSPDYLRVMEIRLVRGRFLARRDAPGAPLVGVIDEEFARTYFPNEDPIGRRLRLGYKDIPIEIVGVVGHVKQWGLDEDASSPVNVQLYTLASQMPDPWTSWLGRYASFVLRTERPNAVSAEAIRAALGRISNQQAAYDFTTADEVIAQSLASRQFLAVLLGIFAASAVLLASIGIYGVMSYLVAQRTHEIGVRMALGAKREDVLRSVLGQGTQLAVAGVGIGVCAALGLARLMTGLLFRVTAHDPVTFSCVSVALTAVAVAACYFPARKAMRVDPMVALRQE